ncbi:MAG TPA: HAMP domain-containing sensor histidine kinase [Oscillospiraceae bacterium]|nr:HAMP domain-containing sensor histidine kinase [Oscillospiraceae bacterium]HXK78085.1 HAMP domain-containing sensor histidine kinase [Oscillospiraceae bacterium]
MKRIRFRLTLTFFIVVALSSAYTLIMSSLIRNDHLLKREDLELLISEYAVKDLILLLISACFVIGMVILMSRRTSNPIVELSKAAEQIAAGNFDVQLNFRERAAGKTLEYQELQRNFNLMVTELRSNAYLRKDFISNVSHEFKTPLSIIGGYAKLLQSGGLSEEEEREYAGFIAEETERLTELTGNLLRLSRLDHQKIVEKKQIFSLDEQIRQTILQLEPKWSAKKLSFDVTLVEVPFAGDEDLLSCVWFNLLDNAVKFSGIGGGVSVSLRKETGKATARFVNGGADVTEETAARAFELFYQQEGEHRKEGSGLGLALAKRIVELHGGGIFMETTSGGQVAFTVELPC